MLGIALLLQAASGDPTQVEQLPGSRESDPVIRLPRGSDKPPPVTVIQVPKGLEPKAGTSEAKLVPPAPVTPASRAEVEIARATGLIRDRGQQVTPELLARELGPDVLDVYLAQTSGLPPTGLPETAPKVNPGTPTNPLPGGPR